jgi:hypothetical protein
MLEQFKCVTLNEPWARRRLLLCARDFAALPGYAQALLQALTAARVSEHSDVDPRQLNDTRAL